MKLVSNTVFIFCICCAKISLALDGLYEQVICGIIDSYALEDFEDLASNSQEVLSVDDCVILTEVARAHKNLAAVAFLSSITKFHLQSLAHPLSSGEGGKFVPIAESDSSLHDLLSSSDSDY